MNSYDYQEEKHRRSYVSYLRHSRAVGVLWGIFTICFAVLAVLVFIQTHWISHTELSERQGHFGLYQACNTPPAIDEAGNSALQEQECVGGLDQFSTIYSDPNKAATVLVGLAVIFTLLSIACMVLFIFASAKTVFVLCGCIQFLAFLCLLVGCLVFPVGWSSDKVREVCGGAADIYEPGTCAIRWAYILAIIGILDILLLSVLAFVLSMKQKKPIPYNSSTSGHANAAYSDGSMIRDGDRASGMIYNSPQNQIMESESQFSAAAHHQQQNYGRNFQL